MAWKVDPNEAEERDHPTFDGVRIKVLYSREEHGAAATIVLSRVPAGVAIPEHVHEGSDDILHVLRGRATMEIRSSDGAETFPLVPGLVVRVPMNTPHRVFDVADELEIFDVFAPAAF
ncbi:MAG: cupin domain-containing protein [Proteobacteria bacterium]|nr:cupin domain-containing protein [Pseudomonadota bacterium]MBU1743053.1 cupin domain-containing protein [Pseudomonadota bacterium]